MSNLPKINPAAIYVCLMGHAGPEMTVPTGARLRGSEPEVKKNQIYYLEEPFSDSEKLAAMRERWPDYIEPMRR